MALTREQYDDIMRGYMQKQNRQNQLKMQRREEVYSRIPGFKELSDRVPEIAVGYLYSRLGEKDKDQSASPLFVRPELDKIELYFFAGDSVLANEEGEIVTDEDVLIGDALTKYGFNENDESVIFVRNESVGADYEITKTFSRYSDVY